MWPFEYEAVYFAAKDVPLLGNEVGNKRSWQEYYQWIPIVFCIQALCFYFPYYLWKTWEAGHMQYLVKDIGKR